MKKLIIYITFMYPNKEKFFEILTMLDKCQADVVEIGIPAENPYLDGDIVKHTYEEVLKNKITIEEIKETLQTIKEKFSFKSVVMTYDEGIKKYSLLTNIEDCCDGLLCSDRSLKREEFSKIIQVYNESIESTEMNNMIEANDVFCYVMSGIGKTGSMDKIPNDYIKTIKRLRNITDLPIYVGFGVKGSEDVIKICSNGADGVIIGSHFLKVYNEGGIDNAEKYVKEIKNALASV